MRDILLRVFFKGFFILVVIEAAYAQKLDHLDKTFVLDSIRYSELLKEQEFLEYDVKVGFFSVGIINFRKFFRENSNVILSEVKGYTKGLAKLFFNLDVDYKSFFLEKEFIPLLLVKLIKEGDQKKIEEISFDNNLKRAYYQNKKNEEGEFFFYENKMFDLFSGFNFFRSNINTIYKDSSTFHMPYIHNGSGIKTLKIDLVGIDKILISNILFKAIKFLCVFESTNKLFEKKTEVYFWVSDDKYNLPLYIETKTRISKVKIELKNAPSYLK